MSNASPQDEPVNADDAVERLARAAHKAIDRAAASAEAFSEQSEAWLEAATNHVREKPLTSLLIAVAAGLLADRLLCQDRR